MTQAQRKKIVNDALAALLKALPDVWAIYLYGSFARGDEFPGSDLDLAVLLAPREEVRNKLDVVAAVCEASGRDVDLVDLRQVGHVLQKEILVDGQPLYIDDADAVLEWEASALSDYAHHRQAISGILDDFAQTGVGYAK